MIGSTTYIVFPFRRSILILATCMCLFIQARAQFAPVVGFPGTTAIHYDSAAFVAWATGCTVQRGYQNVTTPGTYATAGDSSAALGIAGGNSIVSLGDGGIATLTFEEPIINGSGFDFAVFENGFSAGGAGMAFLELAFVEVSSDGVHFVRFPAVCNTQDSIQLGNGGSTDGSLLNNLAGKYTSGYGTPFDLDDLKDSTGLDVNNITHVRVIDVVGTIDSVYATRDIHGHKINDPYPTPFASSGFDLDAVGVIHSKTISGIDPIATDFISIYPNPVSSFLNVQTASFGTSLQLTDISGRIICDIVFDRYVHLDMLSFPAGIYTAKVIAISGTFSKLIVKE